MARFFFVRGGQILINKCMVHGVPDLPCNSNDLNKIHFFGLEQQMKIETNRDFPNLHSEGYSCYYSLDFIKILQKFTFSLFTNFLY